MESWFCIWLFAGIAAEILIHHGVREMDVSTHQPLILVIFLGGLSAGSNFCLRLMLAPRM